MKFIFYCLLFFSVIIFSIFLYYNPGNIAITFQDKEIIIPSWLGFLSITSAFLALIILNKIASTLSKFFTYTCEVISGTNTNIANKKLIKAFNALLEKNWSETEKLCVQSAKGSKTPNINYIIAAKAAHAQNAMDRCEQYLQQASLTIGASKFSIDVAQAELYLESQDYQHSLTILKNLRKRYPKHARVLELLNLSYQKLELWDESIKLLPQLRKHKALPISCLDNIEKDTFIKKLNSIAQAHGKQETIAYWNQSLSKKQDLIAELAPVYAKHLLDFSAHDEAESLIRKTLKKHWKPSLVKLYGLLKTNTLDKQINTAESWLSEHPEDATLLLSLGRLCIQKSLWGKAKQYLESALALQKDPDIYAELGRLHTLMGEPNSGQKFFQKGLSEVATLLPIGTTDSIK